MFDPLICQYIGLKVCAVGWKKKKALVKTFYARESVSAVKTVSYNTDKMGLTEKFGSRPSLIHCDRSDRNQCLKTKIK